ncbi:hypothetical protein MMC16_004563 [Acarospora aff. strigata]|nr:hypothetical protein [Acarospora aff. strigata]
MASSALLRYCFLSAAIISAAAATLRQPLLWAPFVCSVPPQPPLSALECVAAARALPGSLPNLDWHIGPAGIVYDTTLTTLDDPSSPWHLPRTATSGNCRVKVEMEEGVHFARVLWTDVTMHILSLVRMCVGDARILPSHKGSGCGGLTSLGPVKITVEYGGPPIPGIHAGFRYRGQTS